jgi:para-nitrobenzyl esterase
MKTETTTTTGRLRGRLVESPAGPVAAFRGVRYARAERFGPPMPSPPSDDVVDASTPGPAAPQLVSDEQLVPDMAVAAISEDCLAAEIWTPDVDGRRPVLVWVPGGRYQIGGAGLATYDGSRLAAEGDLVVVGVNYRLGALGFLAADDVPSNLGLRDLLAALRWLRAEAAAFGGDPDRIILMGESAGAGAIAHLLAIPETESLIAGAILQSGAPASTLTRDVAAIVTDSLLRAAGVVDVEGLRTLPIDELLTAQAAADAEMLATVGMMPLHPVVDDDLLTDSPVAAARAGALAAVPLVIGTTMHEMELFRDAIPELPVEYSVPFLASKLTPVLGAAPTDETVGRGLDAVDADLTEAIADTDLHLPAALIADAHAARGLPVWRYRFGWQAPTIKAAHATDLPFTFGTLDVDSWREFLGAGGDEATEADSLSARMRSAWASFCHSLHPECPPVGPWPLHDPIRRSQVVLGRAVEIVDDLDGERFRAWTGIATTANGEA